MKKLTPGGQAILIGGLGCLVLLALQIAFLQWQMSDLGSETQELELFYMYGDQEGAYFLEPQAEYENVIYVPRGTLDELPDFPTELGERFTGTFDSEGWELLSIKHKEVSQ